MSQIVAASEEVPLLSLLLKLDMAVVREILNHTEFQTRNGSSEARGIAIGKTTVDLLKPCSRVLDLLDAARPRIKMGFEFARFREKHFQHVGGG